MFVMETPYPQILSEIARELRAAQEEQKAQAVEYALKVLEETKQLKRELCYARYKEWFGSLN